MTVVITFRDFWKADLTQITELSHERRVFFIDDGYYTWLENGLFTQLVETLSQALVEPG